MYTYLYNQTNIYFQDMSHINDLISVLRGLRLVVEAGVRTQQETSAFIWNNSSVKPLLTNCPTNLFSYNPEPPSPKEIVDRALVVAHGFRQFATMYVPNVSDNTARTEMDQQMKDEIDELNREFNRTFDTLKKVQIMDESVASPIVPDPPGMATPTIQILAPIEDLQKKMQQAKLERDVMQGVLSSDSTDDMQHYRMVAGHYEGLSDEGGSGPRPSAKKKLRVAVSSI